MFSLGSEAFIKLKEDGTSLTGRWTKQSGVENGLFKIWNTQETASSLQSLFWREMVFCCRLASSGRPKLGGSLQILGDELQNRNVTCSLEFSVWSLSPAFYKLNHLHSYFLFSWCIDDLGE